MNRNVWFSTLVSNVGSFILLTPEILIVHVIVWLRTDKVSKSPEGRKNDIRTYANRGIMDNCRRYQSGGLDECRLMTATSQDDAHLSSRDR